MILNNYEKIKSLLEFQEGIFYYVQVIQRKKDNPEMTKSDVKRYSRFITSEKSFNRSFNDILDVCNLYGARCYISLNPRSLEKLGKYCLQEFTNRVINDDYKNVYEIPERVALWPDTIKTKGVTRSQRWMWDIDEEKDIEPVRNFILENKINILTELESPHGLHIITDAFDRKKIIDPIQIPGSDDYKIENSVFTFRPECNVILYANLRST